MSKVVKVTTPCRIDIGGTWDMDMFSLPYQYENPSTITIALDYRTHVEIAGYKEGRICVEEDLKQTETTYQYLPFSMEYGLIYAIITYFNIKSLFVKIHKEYPFKSGLGGSGSLAVCLVAGISEFMNYNLSKKDIVQIAHNIESSLSFSLTGYQDQCASMFGGVKLWSWKLNGEWASKTILSNRDLDLANRLVIAYTGSCHAHNINDLQINSYLAGYKRKEWLDINRNTIVCARAMEVKDWEQVSNCVSYEHKMRVKIVPERLSATAKLFQDRVADIGNGFGIAGSGGCVFYLADEPVKAKMIRNSWEILCEQIKDAKMIEPKLAGEGLIYD